ncbi:VWA domain-containing protein [Paenibacillus sp. FJAT-26967]|uniref:vWA domain-containing protein n=1 Tax=Paenibacillus sp. FJAT-26967 TaxID=1729690 RepID=UPI000839AD05|nr:vWA domain-containing protein [Paenibacillus sp. FJAT-26967]
MKQRKWSPLLTLFSVIGGFVGFFVGEYMLNRWGGSLHEIVLMGLYFGQFALFVGLFCLVAEMISPELNGRNWRLRYAGDGWKFLVPATLVMLFVAGALFQLLYGLQFVGKQAPRDYVLVLDKSESMVQNDPGKQSLEAAKSLIGRMNGGNRVALFTFNEDTQLVSPLTSLKSSGAREDLQSRLDKFGEPVGMTDIGKALTTVMDELKKEGAASSKAAVILISDGYSDVNTAQVLAPYLEAGIPVHTVGIDDSQVEGIELLQRIAGETNASFHDVKSADQITGAFEQIYASEQQWNLVSERLGPAASDSFHGILRVALILLIGTLIGLSLGIIFDNRHLALSFAIGGTIAGLIAGLVLELSLPGTSIPAFYRAVAAVTLAFVLSLATLIIPVNNNDSNPGLRAGSRQKARPGASSRLGDRSSQLPGKQFR